MSRLKFSVALSPSAKIRRLRADDPVSFIPMDAIKDGLGGVDSSRAEPLSVMTAGSYNYLANDDVLLAKVTPCFENGKKGRAEGLINGVGFATSEVYVLRPDASRIDPDFLLYLLSSEDFRFEGIRSMTGAGGLKRVSAESVRNYDVKISNPDDQVAIARFLDRETGLIDGLIEKKTRFIALLKEKRAAVITHAVTKGLDPDAPMKDSGVEWIGCVPAHWSRGKLSNWVTQSGSGTTPSDEVDYSSEGIPWVTTGEVRENLVCDTKKYVTKDAVKKYSALKVHPAGSLLVAMYGATIGRVGVLGVDATVNQACFVAYPSHQISTGYLQFWFEAFRKQLIDLASGGGQPNVNAEKIRAFPVAAPKNSEEQKKILSFLKGQTARIDGLIALTERSIDLLREKRSALITAAVTGKIDVRAAA